MARVRSKNLGQEQMITSRSGAQFEILVDGKPRSYRDIKAVAIETAEFLKGIVSKRKESPYRSGRSPHWIKSKNPAAPAMRREAEEDWSR